MRFSYRKRILLSFVVAAIVLLTVGGLVFLSFVEMRRQSAAVDHTYEVISKLDNIMSGLKDVQSSQRGYVITGTEDYLVPFRAAEPEIHEDMDHLRTLIADNREQEERLSTLSGHVKERIQIALDIIEIYRTKGQSAAFDAVRKGTGKREMDEIRNIIGEMIDVERSLLEKRRDALERSAVLTTYSGLAGLLICLSILAVVFSLIHREAAHRASTEETLQKAFHDMEKIAHETKLMGTVGDYLRGCRTEDEAYKIIEKNMPILFPHSYGSISIFNNSRNLLQTVLSWGTIPAVSNEFDPEDCWALRQGKIHQALNDGVVPMCSHLSNVSENTVNVCLPMQAQGQTIGQIYLGSGDASKLEDHQINTLRNTGEQISLALANLNLQRVLREQSIKDPLTKVFNRRYLEETLSRECIRAQRNKQPLCVVMMDIDHFKKVNDTYGHDAGDAVLVAFAQLLMAKTRKDDIVCRLGGEEFVTVLPTASLELAHQRAVEICEATRNMSVKFQGQSIPVTVSLGVAMYPDHADTPEELMRLADEALYKAKQGGRNRVILHEKA